MKKGFTLIELSLSIVFISILSITIVMIINNTITSYRRGLTLNKINSTGMDLVDDLRGAVQNSSTESIDSACSRLYSDNAVVQACLNDKAHNFVSVVRNDRVIIGDGTANREQIDNAPVFGAFCTGSYSYIWNSGYFLNKINADYRVQTAKPAGLKYKDSAGAVKTIYSEDAPFRLLKVEDEDRSVCISATLKASGGKYTVDNSNLENIFDISSGYPIVADEPLDILSNEVGNTIVLYDLLANIAENESNNALFYSVSFILGTVQGGINVKASGNSCATPNEYAIENFDYCSINKFNFAVRANGA